MDNSNYAKIEKLDGSNWPQWKFQVTNLLRTHVVKGQNALRVVTGDFSPPEEPGEGASGAAITAYNDTLSKFDQLDAVATTVITSSMNKNMCSMVMMCKSAKEIWEKLFSVFEQMSGQRLDYLISQLFNYQKGSNDTIAQHVAKLETLFNELNEECEKLEGVRLPASILMNRILNTLPDEYFEFKTIWESRPYDQRSVKGLMEELCLLEQRLLQRKDGAVASVKDSAFVVNKSKAKFHSGSPKDMKLFKRNKRCFNCNKFGHFKSECTFKRANGHPANVAEACGFTSSANLPVVDKNAWYADSGATEHMTNEKSLLTSYETFSNPKSVRVGNENIIFAYGKGKINIEALVDGAWKKAYFEDVWYVPDISVNLFSLIVAEMKGYKVVAENGEIKLIKDDVVCAVGKRNGKSLYCMCMKSVVSCTASYLVSAVAPKENHLQVWHERLAHQNKRHVSQFVKAEGNVITDNDEHFCESCVLAKHHRLPFHSREVRATKVGEIVHSDVMGPMEEPSLGNKRYCVSFKDDYSKYRCVYFIKEKSEVVHKIDDFIKSAAANGHNVKTLLTDNGTEYDNRAVKDVLNGIEHRMIMPYTPEQNGSAERENRTLVEAARAMLNAKHLPKKLWAEAINTACYVLNRSANSAEKGKTPYELWHGRKGAIHHLHIFGTDCFVHVPKQKRKKWDAKAMKGILVGYCGDKDGFRVWVPGTNIVHCSHDVKFKPEVIESNSTFINLPNSVCVDNNSELNSADKGQAVSADRSDSTESDVEPEPSIEPQPRVLRDRSTLNKPVRFNDYAMHVTYDNNDKCVDSVVDCVANMTFAEAMASSDSHQWKLAMEDEMKSLHDNGVWELTDLPNGQRVVGNRWVFRIKQNPDGSTGRYKARLVAKGYSQREGVDYTDTFSPVARMDTIRTLLSVAASEHLQVAQFDVKTAFLYGDLDEEIYMSQPEGCNDGSGRVCRLRRSLYGLKQAPRCWCKRFTGFMMKFGFVQSKADPCLYIKNVKGRRLIVALYVDDGLVVADHQEDIDKLLEQLRKEFEITSSPLSTFLGVEIKRLEDGSIFICQEQHARKVLEKFNMADCNPLSTPCIVRGDESDSNDSISENTPYRAAVGSLMYLATSTRPDLAYPVSIVAASLDCPTAANWSQVKRILRYLKGTLNYGIVYKSHSESAKLLVFSDADYAQDSKTRRSTSGVVCLYAGGAISWMSQKQRCVSLSTTEAELIAANEAGKTTIWLMKLFDDLDLIHKASNPTIQCDNIATVRLIKNPEFHSRTKHIDIRYLWLREKLEEGCLSVEFVSSVNQLADFLTKPCPRIKLANLMNRIGMAAV